MSDKLLVVRERTDLISLYVLLTVLYQLKFLCSIKSVYESFGINHLKVLRRMTNDLSVISHLAEF
jgi:hypothetical protein